MWDNQPTQNSMPKKDRQGSFLSLLKALVVTTKAFYMVLHCIFLQIQQGISKNSHARGLHSCLENTHTHTDTHTHTHQQKNIVYKTMHRNQHSNRQI